MKPLLIVLVLVLFSAGAIACTGNYPEPKAESETVSGWYGVRSGDTLSSISVLFYGDVKYWHHLKELNVEMGNIENSSLHSSDRIFVPNARQNTDLITITEAGMTLQSARLNSFLKV